MIFKVLDGYRSKGEEHFWMLPEKDEKGEWTPGEWMPPFVGALEYSNGYHLYDGLGQLLDYLGSDIYAAEFRGAAITAGDKIIVRECRLLRKFEGWTERTARLFSCACAEAALDAVDRASDITLREVVATARRYADGKASSRELTYIWNITESVAWSAAWSSRSSAENVVLTAAASIASSLVAKDATEFSSWNDAWVTARAAQAVLLGKYIC